MTINVFFNGGLASKSKEGTKIRIFLAILDLLDLLESWEEHWSSSLEESVNDGMERFPLALLLQLLFKLADLSCSFCSCVCGCFVHTLIYSDVMCFTNCFVGILPVWISINLTAVPTLLSFRSSSSA